MQRRGFAKRAGAFLLALWMVVATAPPPLRAQESLMGTVQVSGAAWAASPGSDWAPIASTRPFVVGDRLKTGPDGYLLTVLGESGVIGLYGDAEVATMDRDGNVVVEVQRGKVAFHLEPNAKVRISAQGGEITVGASAVDGYVEYDATGGAVLVAEADAVDVRLADGSTRTLARGQKVSMSGESAVADAPAASVEDERRAGAVAAETQPAGKEKRVKYGPLTLRAWTAVGVVAAGVIGGGVALAGAGGGGGGDKNGSPSGE